MRGTLTNSYGTQTYHPSVSLDDNIAIRYALEMITSFRDEATETVWKGEFTKKLPNQIQSVARRKLRMVNNARSINDLRIPPNNRLEMLAGDRAGQWSIRINDRWRLCFRFERGNAFDVEIVDYH